MRLDNPTSGSPPNIQMSTSGGLQEEPPQSQSPQPHSPSSLDPTASIFVPSSLPSIATLTALGALPTLEPPHSNLSSSSPAAVSNGHASSMTPNHGNPGEDPDSIVDGSEPTPLSNGHGPLFKPPSAMNGTARRVPSFPSNGITRVNPPGSTIYPDSTLEREEVVRLMLQTLKDVGYHEAAATLEAESGYRLEASAVSEFRRAVLEGNWPQVIEALRPMGVRDGDLIPARLLVSEQSYLELLEAKQTGRALQVLRTELAPLSRDSERLHLLSSLMMCMDAKDLAARAKWDGAKGSSREKLLNDIQRFIPSESMVPQRRLVTLLEQARSYQRAVCLYHHPRAPFSLYCDHECSRSQFPTLTTYVLAEHAHEVWNIQWSHSGRYLASASKDHTAIIWKIGPQGSEPGQRECAITHVLRDFSYHVGIVTWSMDDRFLLTGSEQDLKMWNVQTGLCVKTMSGHTDTISGVIALPDGSGFISGGMDYQMIFWDKDGEEINRWDSLSMRILDLAITPDGSKLVSIGYINPSYGENGGLTGLGLTPTHLANGSPAHPSDRPHSISPDMTPSHANGAHQNGNSSYETSSTMRRRMSIYDMNSKEEVAVIPFLGELTSISISADSKYALINHTPDDVQLWDLNSARIVCKYTGLHQRSHVLHSCFGGSDDDFILSGSEDGNVYIWRRDTGTLMEVLVGHGGGSVNAVAWNPKEIAMFASCSDDHTIRIWEAPLPGTANHGSSNSIYDRKVRPRPSERPILRLGNTATSSFTLES